MYYTEKCTLCINAIQSILSPDKYRYHTDENDVYVDCPSANIAEIVKNIEIYQRIINTSVGLIDSSLCRLRRVAK